METSIYPEKKQSLGISIFQSSKVHIPFKSYGNIYLSTRTFPYFSSLISKKYLLMHYCPKSVTSWKHTVRNLQFLSKNSTLISRENCRFFGVVKNSWKCCGFGLFSCWQLWFHEKNYQKKFGWKTRENVGVLVKIEFLDKNLTFRIVCGSRQKQKWYK